jgi:hypothetical protein
MSDLTDKLVQAIQAGQLKMGDVVPRLTDQEKQDFSASVERFAHNEDLREQNAAGDAKWSMRGATALGAGVGGALLPAEIGGAGLASGIANYLGGAGALKTGAKYAGLGYLATKLPEPLRTPAEMLLMMSGMKGNPEAAGSVAGGKAATAEELLANPKAYGNMTDEEVRGLFPSPKVSPRATAPEMKAR